MRPMRPARLLFFGFIALILTGVITALAAANTVPATRLMDNVIAADPNQLKPAACADLNLTAIVVCPSTGGRCDGTDASELILGSAADDDIRAGKGDDCILAGDGNDSLRGDQNNDVCIGGAGTDSFHPSCETEIQ